MESKSPYKKTKTGIAINVRVEPRSSKKHVAGIHAGALKVKLTAPPVDGEANEQLTALLAAEFKVRKSAIKITKGRSSKNKVVEIEGLRELPGI